MIPDWLSNIVLHALGVGDAECVWNRVSLGALAVELAIDATRDKGRGGRTVKYLRPILQQCGTSKALQARILAEIFEFYGNDAAANAERNAVKPKPAPKPATEGGTGGSGGVLVVLLLGLGLLAAR